MILKNLTKNTILAADLKECVSFKDRNLGLLDSQNPRSLLFKTRFGIHTLGLGQPIDVLVLNIHPSSRHPECTAEGSQRVEISRRPVGIPIVASGLRDEHLRMTRGESKSSLSMMLKVVKQKPNLKPNRLFFWNPNFDTIVELPQGTISNSQTQINDTLILIP